MIYDAGEYDIAIIGGGHAGCEAAYAASKMGLTAIMFCINLDTIANCPCNPCIGGTAKGHLVREIDALGGIMGIIADKTTIQNRMLNKGKGPAVHSIRAQIDRKRYSAEMKNLLENLENLDIYQAEVVEICTENDAVCGVITHTGGKYKVKSVIICTGTYLNGRIIIGDVSYDGGPDGVFPSKRLTDSLKKIGVPMLRFKTGTPARVNKKSINFLAMEEQLGDEKTVPFSFTNNNPIKNLLPCHITYTNDKTHEVIRDNLHRSPLYSGDIKGVGPRYCPSIEDKIVRFADKDRHQMFIEPMGLNTNEMYLQGLSSSLPEDVQTSMIRTIKGLENAKITRPAYAIEYDCADATEMTPALEFKKIKGLFGAGQFNGSSGYEEAAAQGLVAGINASLLIKGEEPLILDRSSSYIGTLIDDLVIKGVNEPYRMMTSRSEYRLLLRQDNADERLTPIGHRLGLVDEDRYEKFKCKWDCIYAEKARVEAVVIPPGDAVNEVLKRRGSSPINTGIHMCELIKRPEMSYEALECIDVDRPPLDDDIKEQVEILIKYEGYIKRQLMNVDQFKRMETKKLPSDIDYLNMHGLRLEARQKLNEIRPVSLGQASRITGVSPADITVLLIYLSASGK